MEAGHGRAGRKEQRRLQDLGDRVQRPGLSADAEDVAPIINHCLDAFGPDRVIFASDWPVCLRGMPLRDWVGLLKR